MKELQPVSGNPEHLSPIQPLWKEVTVESNPLSHQILLQVRRGMREEFPKPDTNLCFL